MSVTMTDYMEKSSHTPALVDFLLAHRISIEDQKNSTYDPSDAYANLAPTADSIKYKNVLKFKDLIPLFATTVASTEALERSLSYQKLPAWKTLLQNAETIRDIILVMRFFGAPLMANRMTDLHNLPVDDSYEKPLDTESARGFARFIISESYLPRPCVTVTSDGLINAEWEIPDYGTLILEFLPGNMVTYTVVLAETGYYGGLSRIDDVAKCIEPAIQRLISNE